jgi:molybdate transport system ATP-binding protein
MDEPLASLDAERKAEILPYIERLRDEARIPIVYVSHSLPEVARLATTMVLLSEGRVAATGTVAEVMGRLDLAPQTGRFEAGAVLETRIVAHDDDYALTRLASVGGEIAVPRIRQPVGAKVRLRIRARDVVIALERPHAMSALNALPGRIAEIAPGEGAQCDLRLTIGAGDAAANLLARVTRRSAAELGLAPGREVFAIIKSIAIDRHSLGSSGDGFDEPNET